jgi:heat shock protein HtpX
MLGLTLLLVWIGQMIGGQQGMIYALIFAGIMNFVSYWFSDKIVLAMYRAREIKENDMPQVRSMVRALIQPAGLPMPRLYFIDTPMPNAFATGRDPKHAAVAVTRGILDILDEEELSGVIAHELSHVRNRDVLISTVAATVAGAIFMLARMAQWGAMFGGFGGRERDERGGGGIGLLVVAIIAPIAAMIIQMAISRSREYQADATGAQISGKPMALANALRKLANGVSRHPAQVSPTTAHMFIVNPLKGESLFALFSTHPPLEERIKRLEKMAGEKDGYKVPKVIY